MPVNRVGDNVTRRLYLHWSYFESDFVYTTLSITALSTLLEEKIMYTLPRTSTTDMEVTSIRLERELKERLKDLAKNQGYQALIRDILWNYVQQKSGDYRPQFSRDDIRASLSAVAQQEERCVLTGKIIQPQEPMLLGFTSNGDLVPLSLDSLDD